MKKAIIFFLSTLNMLFLNTPSLATEHEVYKDYLSIPDVFYKYLINSYTEDDLTNYVLSDLSQNNHIYHGNIDMEQVMAIKKQRIKIERHQQYFRLRFLDTNGDRAISQNEIDNFMDGQEKWSEKKKKKALDEIRSYDKDSNGTISDKEMMVLNKKNLKELEEQFEMAKTLYEENKRKRMISREDITSTIRKVFFTLDINRDGAISLEESAKFKDSLKGKKVNGTRVRPFKKTCSFNDAKIPVPENLAVYAIGAEKGKLIDITLSANRNAYLFDLYVNSPEKPVVLILWAYEGTFWKINISEGTELAGIIVGGFYTQIVTGVAGNTPTFLTYQAGQILSTGPCKPHRFNSNEESTYIAVKSYAEWVLEKPVSHFQLVEHNETGIIHIGTSPDKNTVFKTINDDAHSIGELYSSSRFYPEEDINSGIKEGLIRKATEAEINAWNKQRSAIDTKIYEDALKNLGQSKADEERRKKLVRENYGPPLMIIPREAYVLLNSGYSVPLGIEEYFILPLGAKPTTNSFGRSQLMDMNTMECYTGRYKPCAKIRLPLDRRSNLPAIYEE